MGEFYNKYKDYIDKTLTYALILLILFIFIKFIFKFVAPFVIAIIFSLLLEPLVKLFNKKLKMPRGLSCFIVILLILSLIAFIGTGIVSKVVEQLKDLIANMPIYKDEVLKSYGEINDKFNNIMFLIPDDIKLIIDSFSKSVVTSITSLLSSGMKTGSVNIVSKVPQSFMFIVVTIISTFFFLKDKFEIQNFLANKLPKPLLYNFKKFKLNTFKALIGYFKAQLILMCFTFVVCVFALSILGSKYALLMSVVISIIDALPILGSGFILWPWAVWNLVTGNISFAVGLIINYLIVILVRQFLEPKVLGQQIGIHPIVTLFSIYVGMMVFGVFGFIIGPIIAVFIKGLTTN